MNTYIVTKQLNGQSIEKLIALLNKDKQKKHVYLYADAVQSLNEPEVFKSLLALSEVDNTSLYACAAAMKRRELTLPEALELSISLKSLTQALASITANDQLTLFP